MVYTEEDTINMLSRVDMYSALYALIGPDMAIWIIEFKKNKLCKCRNGILIRPYWDEDFDFSKLKNSGWYPQSLFDALVEKC